LGWLKINALGLRMAAGPEEPQRKKKNQIVRRSGERPKPSPKHGIHL
jgi:hypothetical protein